jgi:hypothetical protein
MLWNKTQSLNAVLVQLKIYINDTGDIFVHLISYVSHILNARALSQSLHA